MNPDEHGWLSMSQKRPSPWTPIPPLAGETLIWIFHISGGAVSDTSKIVILKLLASEYENVFSGAW